jgi:hypothetical protein
MSGASAFQANGRFQLSDPVAQQWARRAVLFLGILMSGGLLIFSRPALLIGLVALSFLLINPVAIFRREFSRIWILLLLVGAVSSIGAGVLAIEPLAIRYSNFVAGIFMLALYIERDRNQFAADLVPILALMSVQALLTVALAETVPGLFSQFQINDATYNTIFYIFTYHSFIDDPSLIQRPDGFFFEPGVLQLYLNIYLYIALFMLRRPGHIVLALAGVISTQSTTGIVIAVGLLGVAYFRHLKVAKLNEKLLVLVLAPLMIVPFVFLAIDNVNEKFYGITAGSSWAREFDLYTGMRVAFEYPLTGIGFDYQRYFDVASRVAYLETRLDTATITERPNSNGIATLFYSIGFPLGLVFLWGMFRQRFFATKHVMFVLLFLSLMAEALIFTPFPLMILYSGLLVGRRARAVVPDRDPHPTPLPAPARA